MSLSVPHPLECDRFSDHKTDDDYVLECLKCHFKCAPKGCESHFRDEGSVSSDKPSNLDTSVKKETLLTGSVITDSLSSLNSMK